MEQRAFARARRANDGDDFAGFNLKVDAFEDLQRTVAAGDAFGGE